MDYPTIDHRGPDFAEIGLRVLDKIKLIFKYFVRIENSIINFIKT